MTESRPDDDIEALALPGAAELAGCDNAGLRAFYQHDPGYRQNFEDRHPLTDLFLRRYHDGLFYYKHFYDDLRVIGDPDRCSDAFYFIPGFNGTPGQVRFGLPSLFEKYGRNIYLRGLYLDEFSCRLPSWMKYSETNLQLRRQRIVDDLDEMSRRFERIRIICSSTGFYYFLAAYPQLQQTACEHILYWVSCAPDRVAESFAQKIFYPLNGFTWQGKKWFAYPNHQWLKMVNPETSTRKRWRYRRQAKVFFKNDLESRFRCIGVLWDYASRDSITEMLDSNLAIFRRHGEPLDLETHVLAATRDGFWDDSSRENIENTLDKYLRRKRVIYKPASHLWVVTPENVSELIG